MLSDIKVLYFVFNCLIIKDRLIDINAVYYVLD